MENKKTNVKILIIEDSADDATLIQRELDSSINIRFSVTRAGTLKEGLAQLTAAAPDLILADLGLPDSHGLATVTRLLDEAPQVPLVVLSGFDDEATATKAVQAGAQDYLVKGQADGAQIERSLAYAIERANLQRELEQNAREITRVRNNLLEILDNNADAIIVVNGEKQVLFANPAAEAMLCSQKQDLLQKPFAFPLKKGNTSEITIDRCDREKTIAEMRVAGVDWEGKPAYLASLRDVTKRKQAEEALKESEDKFFKAFRASPEAVVITRREDGTFLEVNDSFLRQMGYTREEVIGKTSVALKIWDDEQQRLAMVKTIKTKGVVSNAEYVFRTKRGQKRIWLFSADIIHIDGQPCILSMTTDITERKETEDVLRFSDTAFKSIREGVMALDTDYNVTLWNKMSEQIYGLSAEEAIGKNILDIIDVVEDHPGETKERVAKLEAEGFLQEEERHRTYRGEIWADVNVQEIVANGQRTGWVTLIADITERRASEEALRRSEEKFREIISTSFDGIIATDPEMLVVIWNQGATRILDYTEKEMLGQPIMTVIPEKDRLKTKKLLAALNRRRPGQSSYRTLEGTGLKKDGTEVPVELSISSRKSGGSHIVTAIIRDITERKEAEERLSKMKSDLLSNVSHELRTPLQSISGFTKLIINGQVPDEATKQEFLEIIDRESQHLGSLIDNLLDMSRLDAGRFEVYKRPTPTRETFIDAIKSFQSLARDKNITLIEEMTEALPEMEIDGGRLRQVIINLVGNAIKFSEPGGNITVRAKALKDAVLFQVSDDGIGISEEAQKHLFERFYRDEAEKVRGGTGLGLFISKQIIDAHGGRIWAESKPGQGSTFSFSLPLDEKIPAISKGVKNHGKENTGN